MGSITLAADRHFMSPQGMSRAISVLESELGSRLFSRSSNSVALTRVGTEFIPFAEQILELEGYSIARLADVRDESDKARTREYRAYFSPVAFDTPLLYPLLDDFEDFFGGGGHLYQKTTDAVVSALLEEAEVDDSVAVFGLLCMTDLFPERNEARIDALSQAGYEYKPLLQSYDLALVSERSPLAKKRSLSRSDLVSQRFVAADDLLAALRKAFGEDSIYIEASDREFRSHLVALGEAVTFIPGFSLSYQLEKGAIAVPLQDPWSQEIGIAAKPEMLKSGFMVHFIKRLFDYYSMRCDSKMIRLVAKA